MKDYFLLMRLDKPIGFMLLFWPCSWGFAIVLKNMSINQEWIINFFLFFIGSILMRSAGCVYNDIIDKKIDQKVTRTKQRPLASNKLSTFKGWVLVAFLSFLSLIILFQFNFTAIIFGLSSGILIFAYPFMKRITYWPQLFLGIVFNWGVILSYLVFNEEVNIGILLIYLSAVFWTLGYDTIYGYQDIKDDEIIGVKSTSIKFKTNPKKFVTICYLITLTLICMTGLMMNFKYVFFIFMIIPILHMFFYQIKNLNIKNDLNCLRIFKSNNMLGFIIYINIIIGKLA